MRRPARPLRLREGTILDLAGRGLALVLGLVLSATAAIAAEAPSGTFLYGIHHEEYGDIGAHKVSFSRSGEDLMVEVENRISVKVLFITAYRFEADRVEIWRDGRLISYKSETYDDGDDYGVFAEAKGGKLMIDAGHGRVEAPGDVVPTHPWNMALTERSLLMDTKTGALLEVTVAEAGEETIEAGGEQVEARKFVISGDLEREVWYGPGDRWLQMRFDKDGAEITFTLQ